MEYERGAIHWVRLRGDMPWEPAVLTHKGWAVVGVDRAVKPAEIGEQIPAPVPPPGYRPLADDVVCKCPRVWRAADGRHWCCAPAARSTDGNTASGITPSI